ncbi:MAG: nucleoside-diphosphate kinase [Candidatus Doudnabacteria bacterium]|nr:nucleoside-diphosphate kinase [Candidatus Doudnabacteria bacterium]
MSNHPKEERTLVLLKPDSLQRNLLGEIIHRFESRGLKLIGMKMMKLDDAILLQHYVHIKDKPFFEGIKEFMKSYPVVAIAISGIKAVSTVKAMVGPTKGYEAPAGTIRGDFSQSTQTNLIHASDPSEDPDAEVNRFFKPEELFSYKKIDFDFLYGEDEKA